MEEKTKYYCLWRTSSFLSFLQTHTNDKIPGGLTNANTWCAPLRLDDVLKSIRHGVEERGTESVHHLPEVVLVHFGVLLEQSLLEVTPKVFDRR